MPLYDVKCKKCGKKWVDVFATSPTADVLQKCSCGSIEFEKLPSAPAVHFKGEGWTKKGLKK